MVVQRTAMVDEVSVHKSPSDSAFGWVKNQLKTMVMMKKHLLFTMSKASNIYSPGLRVRISSFEVNDQDVLILLHSETISPNVFYPSLGEMAVRKQSMHMHGVGIALLGDGPTISACVTRQAVEGFHLRDDDGAVRVQFCIAAYDLDGIKLGFESVR